MSADAPSTEGSLAVTRSELFHVGIVVRDLEHAKERFSELLGVSWGPVIVTEQMQLRTGDGDDIVVPNRICYSTEPPYLELIEEQEGSPYLWNAESNLHHIGYFIDDLGSNSNSLILQGCPLIASGRMGDRAPVTFTLHSELGVRIEHLDVAMRDIVIGRMCRPERPREGSG